ncbi:serine protease snake-like [Armigeres subalbatus]|uniref:serine protease snake-like n=1 Tax=Armigeres subalbatus TaxID=124917 RepID=UPI002ED2965A
MSVIKYYRFTSMLWFGLQLWQIALVQGHRISERKCKEYIAQNTEQSIGGTLSLDPELVVYERTNCSTSVDLIINGVEALIGEFPHQALLGKPKENSTSELDFYCGGSLISEWFVLTAAHCQRPMIVRLGEHDLREQSFDEEDYEISDYIKHPMYKISKSYYDIALVQLATKIEFHSLVRPSCLWTSDPFNMSSVVATGYGATENGGHNSPVLMKVRLNVMDREKCENRFEWNRKFSDGIKEEQLCVGSQEGGKDTCNGDSGGPIQVATDVNTCAYYIVGITSFGGACGTGTSESVYTKVASYLDWIEETVWPSEWLQLRQDLGTESPKSFNDGRIYFPDD